MAPVCDSNAGPKSREEAIEWAKRAPFSQIPDHKGEAEVEIRPFFELEDFGANEAVEHHREVGKQISKTGAVSRAQHKTNREHIRSKP